MTKPSASIAFIGAGNMAGAVIGGLVQQGYPAAQIHATAPSERNLKPLSDQYGIASGSDNGAACRAADVVVLGVKPQIMAEVCAELAPQLGHKPLLVSLAAGIPVASLQQWLGQDQAIVRAMPNTPSLVGAGASGLYANDNCSQTQRRQAESVLAAVGITQWVAQESLIDAVIAVSGSGPAYFFLAMEAMIDAGIKQGLSTEAATELTLQTAFGAAKLAQASDVDVAELRRRVTSPGGTTAQAIAHFENNGLRQLYAGAMQACSDRAREMAKQLG
ncbi:MAG: pyrroline-5-carboxylate reductase [Cellvibrionaceae bacterium]|nr:pyrroline-5-carboxylate reductase [Cellvibrionaceae bacterium]MCV6624625.1 pyrroline-5-carboxylate reductase [Cellvibrionaceae bacterium]